MPKIPAPFQAPSIDLTAHGKEWQEVLPGELEVGDHVMNFGIITEILTTDGLKFLFAGQFEPVALDISSPIQAFTTVK